MSKRILLGVTALFVLCGCFGASAEEKVNAKVLEVEKTLFAQIGDMPKLQGKEKNLTDKERDLWLLRPDRAPVSLPGSYLVVGDSAQGSAAR